MKKIISAILVIAMAVSLSGCAVVDFVQEKFDEKIDSDPAADTDGDKDESEEETEDETKDRDDDTEMTTDIQTEEVTEAATTASPVTEAPATEAPATSTDYVAGDCKKGTYTSQWLGLRYDISDSMIMATDSELAEFMDIRPELYEATKRVNFAKVDFVYEMLVQDAVTTEEVAVYAEKLYLKSITEEQYLESVLYNWDNDDDSNYEIDSQNFKREIGGVEFVGVEVSHYFDGEIGNHQAIYAKKLGDRMALIVVVYADDASRDALLSGFSSID